jgi:hypothetical protein
MFVYCHLELVNRDFGEVAREFHRRFGADHLLLHDEEVRALQGLASPSHAASAGLSLPGVRLVTWILAVISDYFGWHSRVSN